MKRETKEQKLNRLLGLEKKAVEVQTRSSGRVVGVSEEEIQEFREVQGLLYFFQAPELFTYRICGHCEEPFYVSRKYVAYCSYTCIKKELEKTGFTWRKGKDLEALANDPEVYGGNEPIWIRTRILKKLQEMVSSLPENSVEESQQTLAGVLSQSTSPELLSEPPTQSTRASTLESLFPTLTPSSSSSATTTTSSSTTGGKSSSKKNAPKRRIISAS